MEDTNTDGTGNPTTGTQLQPPELNARVKFREKENLSLKTKDWKDIKENILPVDFLLMTVRDFEFEACLTFLKGLEKSYHRTLGFIYFGDIRNGKKKMKVAVLQSNMGSSTLGGSLVSVRNAVPMLRPRAVFYVGICASLKKEKLKLGDVVVCRKLATYSSIKQTEKGIEDRNVKVHISRKLSHLIKHIGEGWKPPLKNSTDLKVKVCREGVFLSGPEVVNDEKRRAELIERVREATAIECEGEGLFAAAYDLEIEWCVIKGVSDYADGKKSETDPWRQFASIMAASLVAHALKDVNVFQSWPHFKNPDDEETSSLKRQRSPSPSSSSDSKRSKGTAGGSYAEDAMPGPSTQAGPRSTPPGNIAPTASEGLPVKAGKPTKDELEALSLKIGDKWERLGRRLGFDEADLVAFDEDNRQLTKKAYRMLMAWKGKEGSKGTYLVLYNALCHKFVGRKDLAEAFCCEKIEGNGSN